jgi:hypothetical protein
MRCRTENPDDERAAKACSLSRKQAFDTKLNAFTATPKSGVSNAESERAKAKETVETGFDKLLTDVDNQGGWWNYLWSVLSVQFAPDRVLSGMLASPAFFFLVAGLWIGLIQYAEIGIALQWLRWVVKITLGTAHALLHLTVLLATNSLLSIVYNFFAESQSVLVKIAGTGLYTGLMIVFGGVLGAFVFGIYWVLTSILLGMHQDAFSALGVKGYKNFLRMKFEPDKLTIYPIALDKVPGRMGWRESEEGKAGTGSLIEPKRPMRPRLIETPIEIKRAPITPLV